MNAMLSGHHNDHRMAHRVIRPMLIEMNIWPNSEPVWLRGKAARRKAFWLFTIL
jgi:hypothetical protein